VTRPRARERLNVAFVRGSVLLATLFSVLSGSWTVFLLVLGVALVLNLWAHEIRFR
jgi:hypothetical protein